MKKRLIILGIAMLLFLLAASYFSINNCSSCKSVAIQAALIQNNEEGLIRANDEDLNETNEEGSETQELTKEIIMKELSKVMDPEIPIPLVEVFAMTTEDIEIEGNKVIINMNLPHTCPLKDRIMSDIKEQIGKIPGVETVEVNLRG